MTRRNGRGIRAAPKPVPLSEWVKKPLAPVLRGEMMNVVAFMIRRFHEVQEAERRLRNPLWRFWYYMKRRFARPLTPEEAERMYAAALDPAARVASPAAEPEEDELDDELEDGVEEGGRIVSPEEAYEELEEGVKFRDRRRGAS